MSVSGVIKKYNDGYYLEFFRDDSISNYNNIVVTYAVDDGLGSALDELKALLKTDNPNIDNYNALIDDFKEQNFIDRSIKEPIYLPTYICKKVDYVATQYKNSERLKSLISSTLCKLEEPFLEINNIKKVLDLETAKGKNLELIGKIVGVNRSYCSIFSPEAYKKYDVNLNDECFRKLIKLKIFKNSKEIVNYKTLSETLSEILNTTIVVRDIKFFQIEIFLKNVLEISPVCLTMFGKFLPVPPTIKIRYYFDIDITVNVKTNVLTDRVNVHLYTDINELIISDEVKTDSALIFKPTLKTDINEVIFSNSINTKGGYRWQVEV